MRRGALVLMIAACSAPAASKLTSPSPSPSPSTSSSAVPAGMREVLEGHNELRKRHCAPPLKWSEELARAAQAWADELKSQGCAFDHSGTKYGENLAGGTESVLGAEAVVEMWYREIERYDFGRGGFSMDTGHFTQLVWAGTQHLGCGVTSCKGLRIWVCQYDPPGNVEGEYQEHVRPTGCR